MLTGVLPIAFSVDAEVLQRIELVLADAVEDRARLRTLQAERRHLIGHFRDLHVHADGVHRQPAQRRFGGCHAEELRAEARDSAVVEELAVFVAPAGVGDDALFHLEHVARRDLVQKARGVRAFDHVFHQRRDIDQRRAVADRPIFVVERQIVRADHHVARPAAPILRHAQARGALVEGRAFELKRLKHGRQRHGSPRPIKPGRQILRATKRHWSYTCGLEPCVGSRCAEYFDEASDCRRSFAVERVCVHAGARPEADLLVSSSHPASRRRRKRASMPTASRKRCRRIRTIAKKTCSASVATGRSHNGSMMGSPPTARKLVRNTRAMASRGASRRQSARTRRSWIVCRRTASGRLRLHGCAERRRVPGRIGSGAALLTSPARTMRLNTGTVRPLHISMRAPQSSQAKRPISLIGNCRSQRS